MKCPHCLDGFHDDWSSRLIEEDIDGEWYVCNQTCPACKKIVIQLKKIGRMTSAGNRAITYFLCYPKSISRTPIQEKYIEDPFLSDYKEACLVLEDSPKASAALSRRCLQHILREKAKVKKGNLSDEIDQILQKLPTHIAEQVDAIRQVGNFSAHTAKSTNSGEILDVEPGEAEWSLEILEMLFDHYFIAPAKIQEKRDKLNSKLTEAGKKPLK